MVFSIVGYPMFKSVYLFIIFLCLSACSLNSARDLQLEKNQAAHINVRLAMAYLNKHDLLHAKQKIVTAQRHAPSDPMVWYTMAFIYEDMGDVVMANNLYLHALKLAPSDGPTHNNYGVFLCRQQRYREAEAHFLMATHDPNYLNEAAAYHNAALCRVR
jgi:type IV pilus assembly protein PilF